MPVFSARQAGPAGRPCPLSRILHIEVCWCRIGFWTAGWAHKPLQQHPWRRQQQWAGVVSVLVRACGKKGYFVIDFLPQGWRVKQEERQAEMSRGIELSWQGNKNIRWPFTSHLANSHQQWSRESISFSASVQYGLYGEGDGAKTKTFVFPTPCLATQRDILGGPVIGI